MKAIFNTITLAATVAGSLALPTASQAHWTNNWADCIVYFVDYCNENYGNNQAADCFEEHANNECGPLEHVGQVPGLDILDPARHGTLVRTPTGQQFIAVIERAQARQDRADRRAERRDERRDERRPGTGSTSRPTAEHDGISTRSLGNGLTVTQITDYSR